MALVAEVACALTVGERTASALLAESPLLTADLPLTLPPCRPARFRGSTPGSWWTRPAAWALRARRRWRRISWTRTRRTRPVAARPGRWSPAGSGPRPGPGGNGTTRSASKNAMPSVPRTGAWCLPRTGTAWPGSRPTCPLTTAPGSGNRATAAARAMQGPDEDRTLTQLRADVAATRLLGGAVRTCTADPRARLAVRRAGRSPARMPAASSPLPDGVPSPRAQVLITVPVMSLLGATEEPAMLDGYGPIPPSMARQLIADGAESFHRVLIDPRTGARWRSGGPATGSPKPNANGFACATGSARSRAAATIPWTMKRTIFSPGPTAGPPGSATLASPARTPQAAAHHRLDTHRRYRRSPTRLDLTHRQTLRERTARLGTATSDRTSGSARPSDRALVEAAPQPGS